MPASKSKRATVSSDAHRMRRFYYLAKTAGIHRKQGAVSIQEVTIKHKEHEGSLRAECKETSPSCSK